GNDRPGDGPGGRAGGGEAEVAERAEVIDRDFAAGLGGEALRLPNTRGEAVGRDERWDPAIAQPPRATHGRLAVAADPRGHRLLDRARQHGDLVKAPEFSLEADFGLAPGAPDDRQRLVRAPTTLLERNPGGEELPFLLDADPECRQHAAAREVVDHRDLARCGHGITERRDEHARPELQSLRA